jgi:hypothetical protein
MSPCANSIWDLYVGLYGATDLRDLYQSEALFLPNGEEYWIPVQGSLLPSLQAEVSEGESVLLYIRWLGMLHDEGCHMVWTFFVTGFDHVDSGK